MRLLAIFALNARNEPVSVQLIKQTLVPRKRLWLSITGVGSTCTVTAIITRSNSAPTIIARAPVATLASSLSSRPAFVNVKPQITRKRKRVDSPASSVKDTTAPSEHEEEATPVPEEVVAEFPPTPHRTVKRARLSIALSSATLLLQPSSARPAEAKFSPGQVLWASSMLSALAEGIVLAGCSSGVGMKKLLDAVRKGAEDVEMEEFGVGMDGFAKEVELEGVDRLLKELRKSEIEEEVVELESDAEEVVEELEEVDEVDEARQMNEVEVSEGEEFSDDGGGFFQTVQIPVAFAEDSSSDDEKWSDSDEDG